MLGYVWEVFLYLIKCHRFINKGQLHGPWLPVYGFGGLVICYFIKNITDNVILLFLLNLYNFQERHIFLPPEKSDLCGFRFLSVRLIYGSEYFSGLIPSI